MTSTDRQNETTIARLNFLIYIAQNVLMGLNSLMRVAEIAKSDNDTHDRYCQAIDRHLEDMQQAAEKANRAVLAAIDAANALARPGKQ